jgi:hypothetical protein
MIILSAFRLIRCLKGADMAVLGWLLIIWEISVPVGLDGVQAMLYVSVSFICVGFLRGSISLNSVDHSELTFNS